MDIDMDINLSPLGVFGRDVNFNTIKDYEDFTNAINMYNKKYPDSNSDIEDGIYCLALLRVNDDALSTSRLDEDTRNMYYEAYPELKERVVMIIDTYYRYLELCKKYNAVELNLHTLEWMKNGGNENV
jgi:hypothetical protein